MIFNDKYDGNENEIFTKSKFKEFNLPDGVSYTARSLDLIYQMYCTWLNTRHGFYVVNFELSIPDDPGSFCSESLVDYLFHVVQGDIGYRNTGSDKSIGLIWKTYRKDSSTIHEGRFLIPMSEAELIESSRCDKASIPDSVVDIFVRILGRYEFNTDIGTIEDGGMELRFYNVESGEGCEVLFNDSKFELHEKGFVTLCEVAELPKESQSTDYPLFRARCGYNPAHSYVSTKFSFNPF